MIKFLLHFNFQMGIGLMNHPGFLGDSAAVEIMTQMELSRGRIQETGEDLRKMEQEQEAFTIQYHECTKLTGNNNVFSKSLLFVISHYI